MTLPLLSPAWTTEPERLAAGHGPDAVQTALAWLEALGERQAWPGRARFALALCADEALTNIATHARTLQGRPACLWLSCGPTADGLALCIEDDGSAFDPTAQASPELAASLDEARPGGHGLRLMRHYLHRLSYRRAGTRNVLTMEIQTPPEPSFLPPGENPHDRT